MPNRRGGPGSPHREVRRRVLIEPGAIDQAEDERLEIRGEDQYHRLAVLGLGLDVDHARLAPWPALAVIEHDGIVPARERLPDDDPDVGIAPLLDHVTAPQVL